MKAEQFIELKADLKIHIEDVIQKKVNGKIDKLDQKIGEIDSKFDRYVEEDLRWKEDAVKYREEETDPVVETYKSTGLMVKAGKAALGLFAAIGGALLMWLAIREKLFK